MDNRGKLRYDRAGRVDTFTVSVKGDFSVASIAAALITEHAQLVPAVDRAKADQIRTPDTGKEVLLDALQLDLTNIARTARTISRSEPGFADDYRLPDSPGESALLTAGDAMLGKLRKPGIPQKFIDREMPADFVQDLTADLKAIRDYKIIAEDEREDSVQATAALARLVRRSSEIVAELDAIMHNKYGRTDPDKLRRWMTASHLERLPKRPKNDSDENESGTPPAPAKS